MRPAVLVDAVARHEHAIPFGVSLDGDLDVGVREQWPAEFDLDPRQFKRRALHDAVCRLTDQRQVCRVVDVPEAIAVIPPGAQTDATVCLRRHFFFGGRVSAYCRPRSIQARSDAGFATSAAGATTYSFIARPGIGSNGLAPFSFSSLARSSSARRTTT